MKIGNLIAAFIFTLFSLPIWASEFQYEAGLFRISSENDANVEINLSFLGGRYFVGKIDTKDHPWYEAAFLEHGSYVQGTFGKAELSIGAANADGPMYMLQYNHVLPGSLFTFGVNYLKNKVDFDNSNNSSEQTEFGFSAGKYLFANSAFTFKYNRGTLSFTGTTDTDQNKFEFEYKHILKIQYFQAVNLEGSLELTQFDDGTVDGSNTELELLADCYLNQKIGVGGGVTTNSGDDADDEGTSLELRTRVFFSENVYGELRISRFSAANDPLDDSDEYQISVIGRF